MFRRGAFFMHSFDEFMVFTQKKEKSWVMFYRLQMYYNVH